MTYLLDTHTFLWFITDDVQLSKTAKQLIEDGEQALYLSIASVWELAIKVSVGKLAMPTPFETFVSDQLRENNIGLLEIKVAHTGRVAILPFHHRDPFDRLIIAQALSEQWPIIGKDALFDTYSVQRLW